MFFSLSAEQTYLILGVVDAEQAIVNLLLAWLPSSFVELGTVVPPRRFFRVSLTRSCERG